MPAMSRNRRTATLLAAGLLATLASLAPAPPWPATATPGHADPRRRLCRIPPLPGPDRGSLEGRLLRGHRRRQGPRAALPWPVNNAELSGTTDDNDLTSMRVHYKDSDGFGAGAAVQVVLAKTFVDASGPRGPRPCASGSRTPTAPARRLRPGLPGPARTTWRPGRSTRLTCCCRAAPAGPLSSSASTSRERRTRPVPLRLGFVAGPLALPSLRRHEVDTKPDRAGRWRNPTTSSGNHRMRSRPLVGEQRPWRMCRANRCS